MVDAEDYNIGRVLQALEEEGMTQNTLVMFFSDNGGPTNFGARNFPLRGRQGLDVGGRHARAGVDEVAGISEAWNENDAGDAGDRRFSHVRLRRGRILYFAVENLNMMYLGVHHGEWKLVREVPAGGGQPKNYLFRIAEDPNEKNDLAAQNPELVKELRAKIEKWQTLHPSDGVRATADYTSGSKAPAQYAEAARR